MQTVPAVVAHTQQKLAKTYLNLYHFTIMKVDTTINEDTIVTMDEDLTEDLTEEEGVLSDVEVENGDSSQLPNVEEYKAELEANTRKRKPKWCLICLVSILCLALIASFVAIGVLVGMENRQVQNDSYETYMNEKNDVTNAYGDQYYDEAYDYDDVENPYYAEQFPFGQEGVEDESNDIGNPYYLEPLFDDEEDNFVVDDEFDNEDDEEDKFVVDDEFDNEDDEDGEDATIQDKDNADEDGEDGEEWLDGLEYYDEDDGMDEDSMDEDSIFVYYINDGEVDEDGNDIEYYSEDDGIDEADTDVDLEYYDADGEMDDDDKDDVEVIDDNENDKDENEDENNKDEGSEGGSP